MEKTFRIYAKEVKIEKDGANVKFISYSLKNGNTFLNVKFRKEVFNKPTERGYYLVTVNDSDVNVKSKGANGKYDTLWVANVISYKRDIDFEERQKQLNQQKTNKVLDGSVNIFE